MIVLTINLQKKKVETTDHVLLAALHTISIIKQINTAVNSVSEVANARGITDRIMAKGTES